MNPPRISGFRLCGLIALLAAAPTRADDPKGVEFFEKRVRPILVESCYECHSAEAAAAKKLRGGLYLDSKEGLLQGGDSGPAIMPGKPKESLLLKTLHYTGDTKMPPKGKLSAAAVADVESWIAQGAPDPRSKTVAKQKGLTIEEGKQFWSYRPAQRPAVPADKGGGNEVDAFIRQRLKAEGLAPLPEASPVVLIRRVSFDLIGLPPTPEEVDAFVAAYKTDPEKAYEQLVDRLLGSPHFGERWGRHWLDLARYADSLTLRGFVLKEAWRYRDYVIDSFNRDLPYDQFLREQVAGDLLPADSVEQKRRQLAATTFLTLGNTNLEEQDKKQLVMDVVDEQLDVIGKAILGQTITCARCHDHKFDPIPTRDYYALAGILRNAKTLSHGSVSKWLEMPLPAGPDADNAAREHAAEVAAVQKEISELRKTVATSKPANPGKPHVHAVKDLPGVVVDDSQARKVGAWKASTSAPGYVGTGYIHDEGKEKGDKTVTFQPEISKTGRFEVRIAYQGGMGRAKNVPVTIFSADGEKTIEVDQTRPAEIDGLFQSLGEYKFESNGQGYVIVSNEDTKGIVTVDAVLFIPVEELDKQPEPKQANASDAKGGEARLKALEARLRKLQTSGPTRDMVMSVQEETKVEDCKIHLRGSVKNLGAAVPRGFLTVAMTGEVPKLPANQSGRVELADWLAGKENPLTARVYVNRAWHWLFGSGLVRTTDNFGVTGEKPSHPELLDYLASRFVEEGWSTRKLVKQLVMSKTYRQSSDGSLSNPKSEIRNPKSVDPENRLFGRANRRRLDAECIRDAILQASGQLKLDAGGRAFNDGVSSDYNYKHTENRRSVYAPVFRNSLPEIFEAFDFADPSVCTGKRNVSTVAPQALFLMNNPFVMNQAKFAAQRLLDEKDIDDQGRVVKAFRLTLGRAPTSTEAELSANYLKAAPDLKARLDQWSAFMQTLFASIDFRYAD